MSSLEIRVIEGKYKAAVKRVLRGITTGKDLMAITQKQNSDLGKIRDEDMAMLVLYQVAFN